MHTTRIVAVVDRWRAAISVAAGLLSATLLASVIGSALAHTSYNPSDARLALATLVTASIGYFAGIAAASVLTDIYVEGHGRKPATTAGP